MVTYTKILPFSVPICRPTSEPTYCPAVGAVLDRYFTNLWICSLYGLIANDTAEGQGNHHRMFRPYQ